MISSIVWAGRRKTQALAEIIAEQRERSFCTYGYRRMWLVLKKRGIHRNPKTILRVMEKYGLLAEIRRRRKWQQMGQHVHKYQNLLNRNFQAAAPNCKWVTDISYIQTKQGVLYLSMIRDLYDNSIVAYKTATQQTVNLVLDTIRQAVRNEKKKVAAELQLHSDQGFPYTSQAYFKLTKQYGITPSMSRRGNPYDNAMAENFFSILKTECIYRHKPATFSEADEMIDRYIHFYNHERIQSKTGVPRSRCATPAKTEYSCTRGSFCTVCTIWGSSPRRRAFFVTEPDKPHPAYSAKKGPVCKIDRSRKRGISLCAVLPVLVT